MDVTLLTKCKRLLPTVLALSVGVAPLTFAEYSLAANSGSKSTIVVPKQKGSSSTSAHGTLTFVIPSKPTKKSVEKLEGIAGSKNPLRSEAPRAVATPSPHKNSSLSRQQVSQPRRPAPRHPTIAPSKVRQLTEAIRTASRRTPLAAQKPKPLRQTKSADQVQFAEHHEEIAPIDPASKLLVQAHALSRQANSEAEYTYILEQCLQAIQQGVDKEKKLFAQRLTSWVLNRRGQLRVDEGQQELADADFRMALDYNADNWRALHNRGVSLAQNGSYAEAFDDFNRVTQLQPKFAKAFVNRATLFVQAGDLQAALKDYQRAAELDQNLVTAQVGLARVFHALGQGDKALAPFEAAVRLDPTSAEIICSRGDLLADLGRYGEALADYARTIELNPEFAHAYRNGAWLLATCPDGQFRDAENAVLGARQALEFDYGQRHVALDTLAAALANAGQFEEATSTLQYAISLAPDQAKTAYVTRLQLYQQQQPFRTNPRGDVSQAVYEATDQ